MFVAFILILLMLVFFIIFIAAGVKASGDHIKRSKKATDYGADFSAFVKHVSGLPIPSGIMVGIYCTKDRFIIRKDEQEIVLAADKIRSIDNVRGNDLKSQASGAAAGALVFGMTGAAIGALAGTSVYIIISYESDGELKAITLDPATNMSTGKKVAEYYRDITDKHTVTIEL